jgi:hypothetical protein
MFDGYFHKRAGDYDDWQDFQKQIPWTKFFSKNKVRAPSDCNNVRNDAMKKPLVLWLLCLFTFFFLASLLFGLPDIAAARALYSPAGGADPFFNHFFGLMADLLLGLASALVFVIGLVGCFRKRTRTAALVMLACATGYLGGCNSRHTILGNPRRDAFLQLGERMQPLVNAIESYHRDHGAYPATLESLVTNYLPKLPETGMGSYPSYTYYTNSAGNPWIIQMPVGYGMGFDQLYYYPLQNYPGWPYERIGKWAYFHE